MSYLQSKNYSFHFSEVSHYPSSYCFLFRYQQFANRSQHLHLSTGLPVKIDRISDSSYPQPHGSFVNISKVKRIRVRDL
ncbi:hypothetical protein PNK_0325 [Candidatus Protochlamydia naegleriophila]|uniref:Uncharacterized protein n=1 Tax=Candidatus Protochlamydia naegleriophila TaxID=389348 RepID=A0A0U5JAX0_9BACT|nr:hypothetical protein PNK_0325 [Candidatus Protochlamydia naegleriophila]